VILMTDGDFNVGVADPAKLKDFVAEQRKSGVYLSVYGFGRGNYQDLMMQALAQNGNGVAAYVDSLMEARKLLRTDVSRGLFPIADDVKIQVEFNPAQVSEYRLIGYETRLLNREDFNNDRVDAGEVGSGASVTALYELTPVGAAPSSDPLRYSAPKPSAAASSEVAFLKVRYKPPRGTESRLVTRPIGPGDQFVSLDAAPEATRWAAAVAAYGQRLRGDPWLDEDFGWSEIAVLAQRARGEDPNGERAEFVQLVRAAGQAAPLNAAGGH
jgi:Ca-activated chloride channel family protein